MGGVFHQNLKKSLCFFAFMGTASSMMMPSFDTSGMGMWGGGIPMQMPGQLPWQMQGGQTPPMQGGQTPPMQGGQTPPMQGGLAVPQGVQMPVAPQPYTQSVAQQNGQNSSPATSDGGIDLSLFDVPAVIPEKNNIPPNTPDSVNNGPPFQMPEVPPYGDPQAAVAVDKNCSCPCHLTCHNDKHEKLPIQADFSKGNPMEHIILIISSDRDYSLIESSKQGGMVLQSVTKIPNGNYKLVKLPDNSLQKQKDNVQHVLPRSNIATLEQVVPPFPLGS